MTDPKDLSKSAGQIHEGDPFGGIKDPKALQAPEPRTVNHFHTYSDRDKDKKAQHHTLGVDPNQASSGDHVHDGTSSRKIGTGMGLSISGAKGGNIALANLLLMLGQVIEFEDNTTA